jgi:PhzF family phenazine biosynthesis protein
MVAEDAEEGRMGLSVAGVRIAQVDAFTSEPFAGNPAAVCILPEPRDERWMQAVAREMNLPATTFLVERADGFELRWFTATVELELCGHGTLASAHILWEQEHLKPAEPARFQTRSGLLTATREPEWIELDFPAEPEVPAAAPADLARALGVTPKYVGRNRLDYLVELQSEEAVRTLTPDLRSLETITTRGIAVTSVAGSAEYDFVSRFFAPAAGIDEDPVTGSAHCCLGPFGQRRLGKDELVGYQASSRGGRVRVRPLGERVRLGGQAVTVLRGELLP